jgi:type IV pilus assembly protein PilM
VQRWLSDPPPDQLFEIAEYSLAWASPRDPAQLQQEKLAERGLMASPSTPNVLKPQLYRDALPAGKRGTAALIIPDYATRMAILDFEQFPENEAEAMALLRFRLRKSVPFHIEEAQVSYAVQLTEPQRTEVLAVAIARPILEEYERMLVEAGYRVGLVMPSTIAAIPLCKSEQKSVEQKGITLFGKSTGSTLAMLLLEGGRVRLVRSLDLTSEEEGVRPALQQTLAFAEDQLGQPVQRIVLAGFGEETNDLGHRIERDFGIHCEPLRSRFGVASRGNAGVLGMLERFAA